MINSVPRRSFPWRATHRVNPSGGSRTNRLGHPRSNGSRLASHDEDLQSYPAESPRWSCRFTPAHVRVPGNHATSPSQLEKQRDGVPRVRIRLRHRSRHSL